MKTFQVFVRNTETGIQRSFKMHGETAKEIRERANNLIGPDDFIEEIRWTD